MRQITSRYVCYEQTSVLVDEAKMRVHSRATAEIEDRMMLEGLVWGGYICVMCMVRAWMIMNA